MSMVASTGVTTRFDALDQSISVDIPQGWKVKAGDRIELVRRGTRLDLRHHTSAPTSPLDQYDEVDVIMWLMERGYAVWKPNE